VVGLNVAGNIRILGNSNRNLVPFYLCQGTFCV
jgi:hypothetical protein